MLHRMARTGAIGLAAGLWPLGFLIVGNPTLSLYEVLIYLPLICGGASALLSERLHFRALTLFCVALTGSYFSLFSPFGPSPISLEIRPDSIFTISLLITGLALTTSFIKPQWLAAVPVLPQIAIVFTAFSTIPRMMPEHSWLIQVWTYRAHLAFVEWIHWGALLTTVTLGYRAFRHERSRSEVALLGLGLKCIWVMETLVLYGKHKEFATELVGIVPFLCALSFLLYGELYLYWQRIYLDELTGVLNRRALNERLWNLRPHYTIAMIDIDHFKRFNDTFGHEQGDTVLRFVASHFKNPQHGVMYRFGGEEFCILFENISAPHAARILNKMRDDLAKKTFHIRSSKQVRQYTSKKDRRALTKPSKVNITVSIGVAEPQADLQTADDVLKSADVALYRAKHLGRNRVVESNASTPLLPTSQAA
jgi:diguanylate cyclase (GGDEF)-like protein